MTAEAIAAISTGTVAILAALSAMIVSVVNGIRQKKDGILKDGKLNEIHVLVNSRLSQALEEIAALRAYVANMSQLPADKALAQQAKIDAMGAVNQPGMVVAAHTVTSMSPGMPSVPPPVKKPDA